jgi:prepilin peptidase CpaA
MLSGLVVSFLWKGSPGLLASFEGICVAAGICGVFCFLRGMGMGDLKLMAAIGSWLGPEQTIFAIVITFCAGAVIGIIWAAARGSLMKSFDSTGDLLVGFGKNGLRGHQTIVLDNPDCMRIPYAPAIAIGTLFSFFAF